MLKPLLATLLLSAFSLAAADISGAWKLEGGIADVHINRVCTIKQDGPKISGSCKNQTTDLPLTGEVKGSDVTWTYVADYQGAKTTLVFKGTLTDATIKGKIETDGAAGNFTATKQ